MKTLIAGQAVYRLPARVRLSLARLALWRLKYGIRLPPGFGLAVLVLCSTAVGYALAMNNPRAVGSAHAESSIASAPAHSLPHPETAAGDESDPRRSIGRAVDDNTVDRPSVASPSRTARVAGTTTHASAPTVSSGPLSDPAIERRLAQEIGRLQSEILALRLLFLRLADVAELDESEFELDMPFAPLPSSTVEDDQDLSLLGHPSALPPPESLSQALASLPLAKQALVHMSDQSQRLATIYRQRRLEHDFRISGMPVDGGIISSRYGYRLDPFTGQQHLHKGLDLVSEPGSRVHALADGVVTYSGRNGGYGNLLELEHANGYRTRYAHNRALLVPVGARVAKGQAIALMGSSGRSTGTHLHLEVRREGRALDPQLYLR